MLLLIHFLYILYLHIIITERWNEALIDEVWSEDADWIELTPEQLEAALLIGYTEAIWCEDGCDKLVGETLTQNNDDPATTAATPSKAPTVKPITSSPTLRPVQTTLSPLPPLKPTTASPIQPVSDPIYWDDLTSGTQDIYTALGYNEEIWDSGGSAEVDSMSWNELDIKQRFALNALGWTKDTWDASEERFPTKPMSSIDKSEVRLVSTIIFFPCNALYSHCLLLLLPYSQLLAPSELLRRQQQAVLPQQVHHLHRLSLCLFLMLQFLPPLLRCCLQ